MTFNQWNLFPGNLSGAGMVEQNVIWKIVFGFAVIAAPFIHPFGPLRKQHSDAALPDLPLLTKACQNCHSERTEWPLYSYLPVASWLVERDVSEARRHMNLSRWAQYSNDERRDLLARMAAEVRSHRMPPARYTMLHPEARLSEAEMQALYEWTRTQREKLRAPGINQTSQESMFMPQ